MLLRSFIDSVLPFSVKGGGDLDYLLDGMALNYGSVHSFLSNLSYLRDAKFTSILSDLEKEYGIEPPSTATEAERRSTLAEFINEVSSTGTLEYLQNKINGSGFTGVNIYVNEPAVNPLIAVDAQYRNYFGSATFYFGHQDALFGRTNFRLIANGVESIDGNIFIPANSEYWPMVFFLAEDAVRDPVTGAVISLTIAQIPADRVEELIKLIMRYKPMHSWCMAKYEAV